MPLLDPKPLHRWFHLGCNPSRIIARRLISNVGRSCCILVFILTAGVSLANAQEPANTASSYGYNSQISNGSVADGSTSVQAVTYEGDALRDFISTVDQTPPNGEPIDISAELAGMRDRLRSQEDQIASMKSQLRMPSVKSTANGRPRWFSTYESVIVQPLQENTTGVIVETDSGYGHVAFPWQLQHSPRIQFGYETNNESIGWRVRFWQFRHGEAFTANDANGLIPFGNEATAGYLTEDGDITVGLDFIEEGRFTSSVRTDVIDWEMQRRIADPLDLYAGIRYAKAAQRYGAVTDQGNISASSSFRGIGPTIAMRLQHDLGVSRLSLFANIRGSLLFGHKEFSAIDDANDLQQTIGSDSLRLTSDGGDTLSSNAEMQIGLRFAASDWLALTVAFEAQTFTNVGGPNPTGVFTGPDSGLAGDSPMDDSLSFAGITVGTELTW